VELFVYSRAAVERVAAHDVPHWIVSITSSVEDRARIPTNGHTLEVVRVTFLEVGAGEPGAMTDDDARSIVDVFRRHRAVAERVVLHCDAGVSRSPGVAIALARLAGVDESALAKRYRPNAHVITTMARAAI
jgi:predicted protein tyrosine phosphatase